MSVVKAEEFRSRVARIEKSKPQSKRAFMRDSFGLILGQDSQKSRFKLMPILRISLLLYLSLSVFKAVVYYNAGSEKYAEIVASFDTDDSQFKFLSVAMAPDYLTEPIGELVTGLAVKIEEAQNR